MHAPSAHVALLVDFANLRLGIADRLARRADAATTEGSNGNGNGSGNGNGRAAPSTRDISRALVAYAESLGRVGLSRAYADWSRIPQTARQLGGTRLSPVLVPATEEGEDRSHIQLTVDAVQSLYNGDEPDAFVLVSGDPTLLPLVQTIREDGSHVVIVASGESVSEELREAADSFQDLDAVLGGALGEAVLPRAWRTDPQAEPGEASASAPADPRKAGARRERSYTGPRVTDSEFEGYDWIPFIRLIDELEARLPFVGVRYLVNKVLAPHNCGVDDPRIKRDLINRAVDDGMIEMYSVGNVDNRTDPVTACRLDRDSDLVLQVLGESDAADADGADDDAGDEALLRNGGARLAAAE